jgi:CheY-like chemotaxis protein
MPHRVAFLGFSDFERKALASYFRLAHNRSPAYEQVPTLTDADFLVADADHGPSVQLVQAIERMGETVFIGNQAPEGSCAWMMRPIDALHVMRELDGLVARALGARAPRDDYAGPQTTIIQLARQRRGTPAAAPDPEGDALLRDLPLAAAGREPAPKAAPAAADGAADGPALSVAVSSTVSVADTPAVSATAAAPDEPPPLTLRNPQPAANPPPPATNTEAAEFVAHEAPLPVLPLPEPAPAVPEPPTPPRRPPARAARPPAKTEPPRPPAPPPTPRALLVDDSPIALRFLEMQLGAWQVEIDRAATSQGAIALMARQSYDLVFLDIELGPDSQLDGLSLCQRIKQTPALMGAVVVLVSAHHSELDRVRGALAGCDAYLAKPLDKPELQKLMQRQGVPAARVEGTPSA